MSARDVCVVEENVCEHACTVYKAVAVPIVRSRLLVFGAWCVGLQEEFVPVCVGAVHTSIHSLVHVCMHAWCGAQACVGCSSSSSMARCASYTCGSQVAVAGDMLGVRSYPNSYPAAAAFVY